MGFLEKLGFGHKKEEEQKMAPPAEEQMPSAPAEEAPMAPVEPEVMPEKGDAEKTEQM